MDNKGEKILGIGPKMLVAIVFSALLVAIVVGKWGSVSSIDNGEVSVRFHTESSPGLPAPAPAPALAHPGGTSEPPPTYPPSPPPAYPPPAYPPAQPASWVPPAATAKVEAPLQLDDLARMIRKDINGEPQDPREVQRLLKQLGQSDGL